MGSWHDVVVNKQSRVLVHDCRDLSKKLASLLVWPIVHHLAHVVDASPLTWVSFDIQRIETTSFYIPFTGCVWKKSWAIVSIDGGS